VLTEQESEVPAAGPGRAMAEQTASGCVGNPVVGVGEQSEVEPRLSQHLGRICPQALEERRNRRRDADPDGRFSVAVPR